VGDYWVYLVGMELRRWRIEGVREEVRREGMQE
jgi:hypothetical protein